MAIVFIDQLRGDKGGEDKQICERSLITNTIISDYKTNDRALNQYIEHFKVDRPSVRPPVRPSFRPSFCPSGCPFPHKCSTDIFVLRVWLLRFWFGQVCIESENQSYKL